MQLAGSEYKEIADALIDAFNVHDFAAMLLTHLRYRLDLITSPENGFGKVVYETLLWAQQVDRVDELVAGAKAYNPTNKQLQALKTSYVVSADIDLLLAYHQQLVVDLSDTRWQLDRRFVRLTLLLDKGPDALEGRWVPDSRHEKFDSLKTLLASIEERAVILLGRPGSGKTTLLKRLQLEHTWDMLAADNGGRTSFFVSLNGYRADRPDDPPPQPAAWLAAQWRVRHPQLPAFETLLHDGKLLLLLDGLNEMPHDDKADYRTRIGNWQTWLRQVRGFGNVVVFSCRNNDYSAALGSDAVKVRRVDVEPLTPEQIEEYLTLHLGDDAAAVWRTLRDDAQQLELFSAPFFLRLLAEQVTATGEVPRGQAALLTGFVRRTLRREIRRRQRLFEPNELLSEDDVAQVLGDYWSTPTILPEDGCLITHLERLAYRMQDGRTAGEGGQVRVNVATACDYLDHGRARDLLDAGIQINVLDKDQAKREITFFHQLLQEYFAGRVLARAPEPQRVTTLWRTEDIAEMQAVELAALAPSDALPELPTTGWEVTTLLAAVMHTRQEQFVADLMPHNLVLAARCAIAPEVDAERLQTALQAALLARIGSEEADLRARIAAAEALGELDDPRFERRTGPHGAYLWPPLRPIAGGAYVIGDDDGQFDDEKPAHEVTIAPFEMAVFPVTNAEYRLFVAADGYHDERWWRTEGARAWLHGETSNEALKADWIERVVKPVKGMSDETIRALPGFTPDQIDLFLWLKQANSAEIDRQLDQWYPTGKAVDAPEYWYNSRYNHPAQPVVGVSWFEAQAYCAWPSAQTGMAVSLPTEAEWEAAARGLSGRAYAFGNSFDSNRCNTFETRLRRTAPVGVFPHGYTAEGIADLSGNVWEWTSTQYRAYPYTEADGREDGEDETAFRTLRGGSWNDAHVDAPAASRGDNLPSSRNSSGGFRVVVRRPPSHDH